MIDHLVNFLSGLPSIGLERLLLGACGLLMLFLVKCVFPIYERWEAGWRQRRREAKGDWMDKKQ